MARLKQERHEARDLKRKEAYVRQCKLVIEEKRLKVLQPCLLSQVS